MKRTASPLPLVGLGLIAALIGMLPWLVDSAHLHLPLQNLSTLTPEQQPIALLPINQYYLGEIAAILIVGFAIAALCARGCASTRRATGWTFLGTFLVTVIALVQSFLATQRTLESGRTSTLYLTFMMVALAACYIVAIVAFLLLTAANAAARIIGSAVALTFLTQWFESLAGSVTSLASFPHAHMVWLYLPYALLGWVIGWSHLRTRGVQLSAAASIILLVVGRAFLVAITFAAGTRAHYGDRAAILADIRLAFVNAIATTEILYGLGAAIVCMGLGFMIRGLRQRS
ncbi:MAG: hypothetical protein LKJ57_03920 [Ancrocorticia sp.]|jgi:hypothetical protein|nr:hypothetical protein [Ancrocorticia sp.]MCI1896120.1 hypothetical protein [Ancrocorticia sp.]MCI1932599.1 hypothetical protein [Ancrocorticia sp.]MCI1962556.1 hypothetical protein [Ancrocorticia sp.]MCI2002514.1 hypothetical protein [Ancrocorticia sp.]